MGNLAAYIYQESKFDLFTKEISVDTMNYVINIRDKYIKNIVLNCFNLVYY